MEEIIKNESEPCKTKAELMEELGTQRQICDGLRAEIEVVRKDKNYWYDAWVKEYHKANTYEKRMKNMQHTIALLASTIGEIDITALTKEEQA